MSSFDRRKFCGSWRYQRNRLGAAQEILLVSRPVGLDLVKFLKKQKEIGLFEQALTRTISFRFFFFARHTRRFLLKIQSRAPQISIVYRDSPKSNLAHITLQNNYASSNLDTVSMTVYAQRHQVNIHISSKYPTFTYQNIQKATCVAYV